MQLFYAKILLDSLVPIKDWNSLPYAEISLLGNIMSLYPDTDTNCSSPRQIIPRL
jgi:hypothetical protein